MRSRRPWRGEPRRALLDDVADPVERLDILFERRAAEQADLRHVRRAMARQAALAFDRFDHRGFFAADVGAGAAAQMDVGVRRQAGVRNTREFLAQHRDQLGIFVADVDVDVGRLDHPGGDQHAFDEAVRIEAEIIPVLECAGLAFVAVHRHQARARGLPHQGPFAAGGKARAAEPAQAGIVNALDDDFARVLARQTVAEQRVAACRAIRREIDFGLVRMRVRALARRRADALAVRLHHLHMADRADRRAVARAHARRAHDAHAGAELRGQIAEQFLRARHRAGERVAYAHRDRRGRGLAFLHDVEMRVEGRDLVDFGLRELHLLRERREMRGREMAVAVLDEMQVLDQQIAPARPVAEQRTHLVERRRIDLAAFRRLRRAALASGSIARGGRLYWRIHLKTLGFSCLE